MSEAVEPSSSLRLHPLASAGVNAALSDNNNNNSDNNDNVADNITDEKRILSFERTGRFKLDMSVKDGKSGLQLFFIEIRVTSEMRRSKTPSITIRDETSNGILLAVSHIRSWSRICHIGVGAGNEDEMQWYESSRTGSSGITDSTRSLVFEDQTYLLRAEKGDFVVTEEGSGGEVARCMKVPGMFNRNFEMYLRPDLGRNLELVVVAMICSWKEERRRAG